jgi:hypothetical protein
VVVRSGRVPSRVNVSVRTATSKDRDGARPTGGAWLTADAVGEAATARAAVLGPPPQPASTAPVASNAPVATTAATRLNTCLTVARGGEHVRVPAMSDEQRDPSGNTEAFRVFAQREEPAPPARFAPPLVLAAAVAAAVVVLAVILVVALA